MSVSQSKKCNCEQTTLHLHVEIENLKQRLLERERHIMKMETNVLKEAEKYPNGEFAAVMDELLTWQEKYSRLYEAHKRVQKVNQSLEDKLLKIVDKCETEKGLLSSELTVITRKLVDQQMLNVKLKEDNERYKNDLNIAIQLLQCKPSNFLPQRFDMLPSELQMKVRSYIAAKQRKLSDRESNGITSKPDVRTIKVPIPTFPPTAMVYSLGSEKDEFSEEDEATEKPPVDIVSAAILAKVLQEREKERLTARHCQTCVCSQGRHFGTKSTQTEIDTQVVPNVHGSIPKLKLSMAHAQSQPDLIDFSSDHSSPVKNDEESDSSEMHKQIFSSSSSSGISRNSVSPSEKVRGPRQCAVRIQEGTNNVLLDNMSQFSSPILYRRRYSEEEEGTFIIQNPRISIVPQRSKSCYPPPAEMGS